VTRIKTHPLPHHQVNSSGHLHHISSKTPVTVQTAPGSSMPLPHRYAPPHPAIQRQAHTEPMTCPIPLLYNHVNHISTGFHSTEQNAPDDIIVHEPPTSIILIAHCHVICHVLITIFGHVFILELHPRYLYTSSKHELAS
jgi:hypothetical protein